MKKTRNPHDAINAFAGEIAASGLGLPEIIADGEIHRFFVDGDKPSTRNGWFSLNIDGRIPFGVFGSWKTGVWERWSAVDLDLLTGAEQKRIRECVSEAQAKRKDEARRVQADAAERARKIWSQCGPVSPHHSYLVRKRISPNGARLCGGSVLVPVTVNGKIKSLQFIRPDGSKRFLAGGGIAGGWFLIGEDSIDTGHTIMLCEGFATGATLFERASCAVFVAFNAGNLLPVAKQVRKKHRYADITIAADNDAWTKGNPGIVKAERAAMEIGARMLIPDFSGMDTSGKPTDWNDWCLLKAARRTSV